MEKKSFFGEQGLTSTSANHYANLAKEARRKMENYIDNVRFYDTSMKIIGQEGSTLVRKGNTIDSLELIKNMIREISNLNSLVAFFREAIKEKERLAKEAADWEDTAAREDMDLRMSHLMSDVPKRGNYITELEVLESWTIGEQEKYLSLEAEAAVLGRYIHEDGIISAARIDMMKRITNPIQVTENGRDTIIYEYVPTVDSANVDEMYFALQQKHREVQAELNGFKKRIQDAIADNKLKVDEAYRIALLDWNAKRSALDAEQKLLAEHETLVRTEMSKDVQELKIVVPNRLRSTFEQLTQLG